MTSRSLQNAFLSGVPSGDPFRDSVSRWFRELKLNGSLRFLLHDRCAGGDSIAVRDITNPQFNQVAGSELAVDRQIEQREIASPGG